MSFEHPLGRFGHGGDSVGSETIVYEDGVSPIRSRHVSEGDPPPSEPHHHHIQNIDVDNSFTDSQVDEARNWLISRALGAAALIVLFRIAFSDLWQDSVDYMKERAEESGWR